MVGFVKAAKALIVRPMPLAAGRPEAPSTVLARVAVALLKPLERWAPWLIEGTTASDFVRDKSQGEQLFLVCTLLSILLFAVVLPLCDALLDGREEDRPSGLRNECAAKLKRYKSGVDVADVNARDVTGQTFSLSGGCSAMTRQNRIVVRSILRRSFLETIDEGSDEECHDTEEEEEDDCSCDSSVLSTETPTSSPPATPEQERPMKASPNIDEFRMKLAQRHGDSSGQEKNHPHRSTVTFLEKIDEECHETEEEEEDDSSDSSVLSTETPTPSPQNEFETEEDKENDSSDTSVQSAESPTPSPRNQYETEEDKENDSSDSSVQSAETPPLQKARPPRLHRSPLPNLSRKAQTKSRRQVRLRSPLSNLPLVIRRRNPTPVTPEQERPMMASSDIDELRMKLAQHQGESSSHEENDPHHIEIICHASEVEMLLNRR